MATNTGRASGLIPWEKFHGPDAYFGADPNAAMVDLCGNCRSPVSIYFNHLVRSHSHNIYCSSNTHGVSLFTDTNKILAKRFRCRKCPPCRRTAARKWAERGIAEFNAAPRTWFGTFTISEAYLERVWEKERNEVLRAIYDHGTEEEALAYTLNELPPLHSELRRRVEAYYVDLELTKMWKRIRKAGHPLRYCVTTEFGKRNGRLHYHALVHVRKDFGKRVFEDEWKDIGYVSVRLCKSNTAAHYVAKYVSKDGGTFRVKASGQYGDAEKADAFWRSLTVLARPPRPERPEGIAREASVNDDAPSTTKTVKNERSEVKNQSV